ncbi:MAG: tripartite tricarboxylate transporter TctB family protein [Desulfovibrionaceae bacterium]|nr:tripartite tricarboxylate transporter TctB family protein [Desulfovibrionaceae bacterium]
MWKERYEDLCVGGVFLAFTIFYAAQIPFIRLTNLSPISAGAYPIAAAALLFFLSGYQLAIGIKKFRTPASAKNTQNKQKDYKTVVRTFFLVVAYVLLLDPLGFCISSALYVFLQSVLLCPPDKIRFGQFAVISIVASVIVYVIFRYGLDLMLPAGPLAEWF